MDKFSLLFWLMVVSGVVMTAAVWWFLGAVTRQLSAM